MKSSYKSLYTLFGFAWPYRKMVAGGLVALCITSASVLSIGWGIKYLIDEGFRHNSATGVNNALLVLLGLSALLALATFARFYLIMKTGYMLINHILLFISQRNGQHSTSIFNIHIAIFISIFNSFREF